MPNLLHLSDLHFGYDKDATARAQRAEALDLLVKEVGRLAHFPWGAQEPDEHLANFESKVGEPAPVGMFPDGDTPEGVADMAGNVLEWTRSDFGKEAKRVQGGPSSAVA